jgi:hypothetical protein
LHEPFFLSNFFYTYAKDSLSCRSDFNNFLNHLFPQFSIEETPFPVSCPDISLTRMGVRPPHNHFSVISGRECASAMQSCAVILVTSTTTNNSGHFSEDPKGLLMAHNAWWCLPSGLSVIEI